MVEKLVHAAIREHKLIDKNDVILIGVSGGPDSTCLIHVLKQIMNEYKLRMFGIHVNHQLRAEESEQDEMYVRELCTKLEIELFIERADIAKMSHQKKMSIEEAAREVRYKVFQDYLEKIKCSKIAVAHNRSDQAETILFNILRGTGLDGLKGMDYKRGSIIRPLLDVSRSSIETYCRKNDLEPRIDSSNLHPTYTRNKIRLKLIPYIDELLNVNVVNRLCKMSNLLRSDCQLIEAFVSEQYKKCVQNVSDSEVVIDICIFNIYQKSIASRIIRLAIAHIKGDLKNIESIHIEEIIKLCSCMPTGKEIHLPQNIRAKKSYDKLKIYIQARSKEQTYLKKALNIPGVTIGSSGIIKADVLSSKEIASERIDISETRLIQFFDYNEIINLSLRTRKQGDLFKPLNSNGTKTLKKYFINIKVPREKRNKIPLIVNNDGNEAHVVWIIGYRTSDKFKVTKKTELVLRLEYICKGDAMLDEK